METNLLETITNLVTSVVAAKANSGAMVVQVSLWSNPAFITALVTLVAAIASYIQSKTNGKQSSKRGECLQSVAETVEKVHTMVNGTATEMQRKLTEATEKILQLSKENEGLKEKARGKELLDATKTGASVQQANTETSENKKV